MLSQALAATTPSDINITQGAMDAPLRAAVQRMMDWCARSGGSSFLARGLVIDTMGDIATQITSHFPAHVNVAPVLDDMSFVVAENAQKSGQRFQEIALDYIGDGKIPEAARANMQTFVKWYGVDAAVGGDFDGHHKKLRPGWSGGAGAPTDMLKYLNLGSKKGFLLQVCALDITDSRAQSLLADMPLVQAFGANPAALAAAAETISKGGAPAEAVKAVAETAAEIKAIKVALANAEGTPQAAPLAAALALKTETLAVQVQSISAKTPAASPAKAEAAQTIKTEVARIVEGAKVELQARQVANVIETLARAMPPQLVARTANDVSGPAAIPIQAARGIEALVATAKAEGLSVKDAVQLTLAKEAAPAVTEAVRAVVKVMAAPDFLPVLDRTLPAPAAAQIRIALTAPATQVTAAQPPEPKAIAVAAQKTVIEKLPPESPALPIVKAAMTAMDQTAAAAPAMRAQTMQAAAENLQAVAMTRAVPPEAKPAIALIQMQAEAAASQPRMPAPELPASPTRLDAQSTLAVLTKAVDVQTPTVIAPASAPVIAVAKPAASDFSSPTAKAPQTASPIARAAETAVKTDAKKEAKKEEAKGPCPNCTKGFNCAACSVSLNIDKMDKLMGLAATPAATREYKPKVA